MTAKLSGRKLQRLVDIVASMLFMGSLWQLEIAKLNLLNGWRFGWPFSIMWPNNWVASDFFMLFMIVSFVVLALND